MTGEFAHHRLTDEDIGEIVTSLHQRYADTFSTRRVVKEVHHARCRRR